MGSESQERPVFFDPSGIRRRVFTALNWLLASLLGILVGSLLLTILSTPRLPLLKPQANLQPVSQTLSSDHSKSRGIHLNPKRPGIDASVDPFSVKRYGYLVDWDDNGFSSLRRHAHELDVVVGEWLHVVGPDSELQIAGEEHQAAIKTWIKRNAPNLEVMVLINNFDLAAERWDVAAARHLLGSPEAQRIWRAKVLAFVQANAYGGVVLDFEHLTFDDAAGYTDLAATLATELRARGLKLLVAVQIDDQSYQLAELAAVSDALILMTYDQHDEEGPAGPIAGQGWFERKLERAFSLVPPSKLIVSIGSYGYDWSSQRPATEISVQEAWELAHASHAKPRFDVDSLNPTFAYRDDAEGVRHEVWFLDAVTAFNQISVAMSRRPAGLALWRLGTEDGAIWSSFARGRSADKISLEATKVMPPGYDVLYTGRGEALTINTAIKEGRRRLSYNKDLRLIVDEEVVSEPLSTTASRWGASDDKVIALTFDDGPDGRYTPQILDILAEKNVKASFFVVGAQGAAHRDILRRMYAEGHDIGNHTFSHPNASMITPYLLTVELNATRRLLEATVGAGSVLFRPPFANDMEPQTVDAAQALATAASLGYVSVGMNIDPKDFMRGLPAQIVDSTLEQVARGLGNVVLLHDAGGVRSATVAALPRIIDELVGRGYRFVTVHELLGLSRAAAMPLVRTNETMVSSINDFGFAALSGFGGAVTFVFYSGLALGTLRLASVILLAIVRKRRFEALENKRWRPRSVAVIVPAYNERHVICKTVLTLLRSRNKKLEIIVVDDGSQDGTADVVRQTFSRTSRVRVIEKPNGGKSSALNLGLAATSADIVVAVDADTVFDPNAIPLLLRHFDDPTVGAVAGCTIVGNAVNLITRFQSLEYTISQNLDRRALDLVNGITVVPGAIGAWRREALISVGGYTSDTLAEDADVTMRLERAGWKVTNEPGAFAATEAPETIRTFLKQRFRWMFGSMQAAYKHRHALLDPRVPGLGFFGLPNIIIFQFIFTLIAPIVDLMLLGTIVSSVYTYANSDGAMPASLRDVGLYWIYFQTVECLAAAVAIQMDGRGGFVRSLPLLFMQRFCYRQLLYWTAIHATIAAIRGQLVGWGKLLRTGTVSANFGAARAV